MKKGFTLIELLAVIIILAVVALIATPIVLNVVEDAKDSTGKSQAYFLLDAAKNYHAESMFDDSKKNNINNLNDIYGLIELSNKKPDNGKLYINSEGNTALSVIINKKCYKKELYGELEISKDEICDLGYIGNDDKSPSIAFEPLGDPFNSNGWSNKDFFVKITVIDNESGPLKYNWCSGIENCEPNVTQESGSGNALISLNSDSNIVCVIGYDKAENKSEKTCSPLYKLDKISPIFNGINDIFVNRDNIVDLTSGVNAIDELSGIDGTYSYTPTSVDTTKAGTTNITYSVSDNAGNINTITRKVIVDAIAPTVEYRALGNTINSNGWSKEDFFIEAALTDNSGLGIKTAKWCSTTDSTCEPTADMTNNKITPLINIESNNNRICIKATDNNDKTSEIICSDSYKLDKTKPVVGTINISGTLGSNDWYTSNISIVASNGSDTLSGHDSTTTNITSITSNTTGTVITLTTTDKAGNTSTTTKTVKVDKNNPTVTATSNNITIKQGDSNLVSSYFTVNYSISGGSVSCSPVNTSGLTVGNQTVSCTATGGNGLQATSNKSITVQALEYVDNSGANKPILYDKMIPVIYENDNWIYADINNKWYDYDNKQWANAVVLNSGVTKNVGNAISESEIAMMYVWIPRYKYTIFNANNGGVLPQQINIVFESGTAKTGTVTCTTATSGSGSTSESCGTVTNGSSTYTHPAFAFGTKELTGIWVGKFENSAPSVETNSVQKVSIKPNVISWRNATISNFYQSILNIKTDYSMSGIDSHMMKNMEWGAVAYLTQSKYGLGTIDIGINNNETYKTGCGASAGSGSTTGCNAYNTTNGMLASTTGNIYGIYDMSGGAYEYVMGNMVNSSNQFYSSSAEFGTNPPTKYYDSYTYGLDYLHHGRGRLGDATKETLQTYGNGAGGWYGDYAFFPSTTFSWFLRGNSYGGGASAGVFYFYRGGGSASSSCAARAVVLADDN